jgi:hypothetical protein
MMRWRQDNGQMKCRQQLPALEPTQVWQLLSHAPGQKPNAGALISAYAELYDLRGGTVEIEFKEDVRHEARRWNE